MGTVQSWAGTIADIGPIYPFVGSEFALWVVGLVLWITWHVWQSRIENLEYAEELKKYGSHAALMQVLELEENPESTHFHE